MAELLCDECRTFMDDLLDKRIRKILAVSQAEPESDDSSQAHCFHLMEIQRILRGEKTCGVFDDYGK